MTKVAVLLAVFAVTFTETSTAKIYAVEKDAIPLATVAPVKYPTDHGTSNTTKVSIIHYTIEFEGDNENITSTNWEEASPTNLAYSNNEARGRDHDDSEESNDEDSDPGSVDDDSNTDIGSTAASKVMFGSMHAAFKFGSVMNATSTIESTYANWVGPALDTSISSACWRKTHIAKTCPWGFDKKLGVCWMQCPYSYPVECGLECIRQNDDCALAIVSKTAVVVQTALALSSWGMYGDMSKWAKSIQLSIKCSKYLISLAKSLIKYIRYIKVYNPEASQDKLLAILYQSDNVIIDIPVTIAYCIGSKASDEVKLADSVLTTAEYALREIISNGAAIVTSWDRFASFMKNITLGDTVSALSEADITNLKTALESNSTCGFDMKRLLDRTWMTVAELRRLNPGISEGDIRVIMSQSNLVLNDIPVATNNCMNELIAESNEATAYVRRGTLRKTFAAIVDDLISSGTSSNGTFLTAKEYAFKVADRAMGFYAIWDWWYMSSVVSEFFQPICAPTELVGEIDDGSAKKALGMSIVQGAFNNSAGMWTRFGDGTVTITFQSVDTEDVVVNIKSGGDQIDEVSVPAGKAVIWNSSLTVLEGKTLYLDRWRPGFLGFPGTGGGSLLLWVPRSTQGGNLQLTAMLNVS
ncbi:hypothetical protein PR003_g1902 [Phytophthora rubi]|uniref:LysM domain-containing protein n=1 Tax=Phytophthora rubi TaxID=129364 RepID=A0A6A4FU88_9STRA|nr:hypothetical protein PR002_g1763 [Phytophthora rubi]KAE9051200.1 hypothetical protein PR001_g1681 [Phytophthora rubi]KAE9357235.1 hypothetical protein PR003_g1902 [Phytophthora rubi]